MESLGIDPERGLDDFQYVVSEERFNALVQERIAAMYEPPVQVSADIQGRQIANSRRAASRAVTRRSL